MDARSESHRKATGCSGLDRLDLGIVCRREEENLRRLAVLLTDLEARYRDPTGRHIHPTLDRLVSNRVNLLETRLGPLGVMESVGPEWQWSDLIDRSHVLRVGDLEVRVLELAAIIEAKELANREKDQAMLHVLRRTLEEK